MSSEIGRHQSEIEKNLELWNSKPLLQEIYAGFYRRIVTEIDPKLRGRVVELGSGIGNLKSHWPSAISTDLFSNRWIDLACDAYEMPFRSHSLSHLLLFDVFHHLEWPGAFLQEAERVLIRNGRVILFEPYISWGSYPAYGIFHPEPVAWGRRISQENKAPRSRHYYAAQGNATRIFFGERNLLTSLEKWSVLKREAFSAFGYLLSGGYSKPALYPKSAAGFLKKLDSALTGWPRIFAGRCLVVLEKKNNSDQRAATGTGF